MKLLALLLFGIFLESWIAAYPEGWDRNAQEELQRWCASRRLVEKSAISQSSGFPLPNSLRD